MSEQKRLIEARRQTDAMERIADELEYQNAVLSEVARAQHLTAVASNDFIGPDEKPESAPNTRSLLTMIRDQEHERDRDDGNPLVTDGGADDLKERVADLERKMEHVTAHNREDTAPEGRR